VADAGRPSTPFAISSRAPFQKRIVTTLVADQKRYSELFCSFT